MFANGQGDRDSIAGRVIPKTQNMVLDADLLSNQHYKAWIKGKVEQSRERSRALPNTGRRICEKCLITCVVCVCHSFSKTSSTSCLFNEKSFSFQILEAAPHKTAAIWPPASRLTNIQVLLWTHQRWQTKTYISSVLIPDVV